MKKRVNDIESIADTIGMNLNVHTAFGIGKPPLPLTPVMEKQASPVEVIDNIEKKA